MVLGGCRRFHTRFLYQFFPLGGAITFVQKNREMRGANGFGISPNGSVDRNSRFGCLWFQISIFFFFRMVFA